MARNKKTIYQRLASLLLLVFINLIVFNVSGILSYSKIAVGLAELSWKEVEKIDIGMDKVIGQRAQVFSSSDKIIVNLANELYLYDIEGKLQVKKEINSDTTKFIGLNDTFLVADLVQGNIIVIDYLGNFTGEISGLGNIEDIVSVKEDTFVVITKDGDLKVFDKTGLELSSVSLPIGEFLNVDVTKEQDSILVSLLTSDEYNFNSKLISYSMESNNMKGAINNLDTVVYRAKIFDDIVVVIDYKGSYTYKINDSLNEKSIINQRDGELITFELGQNGNLYEIVKKTEVEDVMGESEYHLTASNKDGHLLFDKSIANKCNRIVLKNGRILIHNKNQIFVYNNNGEVIAQMDTKKSVYSINWLSEERLLIEYNDLIEIMDLTY